MWIRAFLALSNSTLSIHQLIFNDHIAICAPLSSIALDQYCHIHKPIKQSYCFVFISFYTIILSSSSSSSSSVMLLSTKRNETANFISSSHPIFSCENPFSSGRLYLQSTIRSIQKTKALLPRINKDTERRKANMKVSMIIPLLPLLRFPHYEKELFAQPSKYRDDV